jgi:hypothetical protein
MDNVKINTSKTLTITLPSDPTSNIVTVNVYHDFGGSVSSNVAATRSSAGVYTVTLGQAASGIYTLNSAGIHDVQFTYAMSGSTYTQSQYINVYTPYLDSDTFFNSYPDLIDSFEDVFDSYELKVRNIINTYCGQTFDYFPDKDIIVDGNNHKNLHLPLPIVELKKVTVNYGDVDAEIIHDYSNNALLNLEKIRQSGNFNSSYYIRYRSTIIQGNMESIFGTKFKSNCDYKIEADFGWKYVPLNVQQATELLISDLMNDDSEYRRHGISSISMDTTSFTMNPNFYESTGNIEADVLLMDYMLFIMDYIV